MNKEQPLMTREKELTPENVRKYFKNEAEAYSEKSRKHVTDSLLRFKLTERWKQISGYERYEPKKRKQKKEDVPGLMDKFEKGDYEPCLHYVEEILGGKGAEQETNTYDLINHKEYDSHTFGKREEDINSPGYQQKKEHLRNLADFLAGELYKKRKSELNKNLSPEEVLNTLEHLANQSGENIDKLTKELEKGDYKKILECLDRQIHQQFLIKKNNPEQESGKKIWQEKIFELRKKRRHFLNLKTKNN